MKSNKTLRQISYKKHLYALIQREPKARLVSQRYKVMQYLLDKEHHNKMVILEPADEFLRDIVYLDRQIRLATEGFDQPEKDRLEQEFVLDLMK